MKTQRQRKKDSHRANAKRAREQEMERRIAPKAAARWLENHPPRVRPEIIGDARFVDTYLGPYEDRLEVRTLPGASRDLARPVYRVPISPRMRVLQSIPAESVSAFLAMTMIDFRVVPYALRKDQTEVRWMNWEPVGVGSDVEIENFPRMRKALTFLIRARELLKMHGLLGSYRPLEDGRTYGFPYHDDWSRKSIDEALEIAILEVSAWAAGSHSLPSEVDLPIGGVARQP